MTPELRAMKQRFLKLEAGLPADHPETLKRCPRCFTIKPISAFTSPCGRVDGYCQPCHRSYNKGEWSPATKAVKEELGL